MIQLPTSLEEIDYEELEDFIDIVHLYIPDGIKRLRIRPYTQQAVKEIIGKTQILNWGQYVNQWEYLRLPKDFETTNPTTGETEPSDSSTLIVDIKNLINYKFNDDLFNNFSKKNNCQKKELTIVGEKEKWYTRFFSYIKRVFMKKGT